MRTGSLDWAPLEVSGGGDSIPAMSCGRYSGVLRELIISAKHDDHFDAQTFMTEMGVLLASRVIDSGLAGLLLKPTPNEVWVVCAPSSWKRRISRREVTPMCAVAFAQELHASLGIAIRVVDAVALKWGRRSQAGKGRSQRNRSREGAMTCRCVPPPSILVIALDDVIASGATIRELCRVLGDRVVLACSIARSIQE